MCLSHLPTKFLSVSLTVNHVGRGNSHGSAGGRDGRTEKGEGPNQPGRDSGPAGAAGCSSAGPRGRRGHAPRRLSPEGAPWPQACRHPVWWAAAKGLAPWGRLSEAGGGRPENAWPRAQGVLRPSRAGWAGTGGRRGADGVWAHTPGVVADPGRRRPADRRRDREWECVGSLSGWRGYVGTA